MVKSQTLNKPISRQKMSFEELYLSFSTDWEKKAERLRLRRWEQLKQKLV